MDRLAKAHGRVSEQLDNSRDLNKNLQPETAKLIHDLHAMTLLHEGKMQSIQPMEKELLSLREHSAGLVDLCALSRANVRRLPLHLGMTVCSVLDIDEDDAAADAAADAADTKAEATAPMTTEQKQQRRAARSSTLSHIFGTGVLVASIESSSTCPAFRAGLRVRDLIHSVNGLPTKNVSAFMAALANVLPGDALAIQFSRKTATPQHSWQGDTGAVGSMQTVMVSVECQLFSPNTVAVIRRLAAFEPATDVSLNLAEQLRDKKESLVETGQWHQRIAHLVQAERVSFSRDGNSGDGSGRGNIAGAAAGAAAATAATAAMVGTDTTAELTVVDEKSSSSSSAEVMMQGPTTETAANPPALASSLQSPPPKSKRRVRARTPGSQRRAARRLKKQQPSKTAPLLMSPNLTSRRRRIRPVAKPPVAAAAAAAAAVIIDRAVSDDNNDDLLEQVVEVEPAGAAAAGATSLDAPAEALTTTTTTTTTMSAAVSSASAVLGAW
jgi:hypothetical protein